MTKEKVIEFLFNGGKNRFHNVVFLIIFWLVVTYLSITFQFSLQVILLYVLMFISVMSVIKIMWYNKKKNIKTSFTDCVGLVFGLIALIIMSFQFYKEIKLENAVHNVIEEKIEGKNFTIDFIDEVEFKEKYIVVGYTIKGEHAQYLDKYSWEDGELIFHDLIRKIEVDN